MREPKAPRVTGQDIVAGLREVGISAGSGLMVHSSLSSFGYLEGGAQTVIEALQEVLTPTGTLLLPSFNHGAPFREGGPGYFDPTQTPTTNGTIPDLFRRLPGVCRSLNPTHAFAAWGREAQRYTQFHHRTLTLGPESPLGLLHADDGLCLLMGVGYAPNTFHHVVEMSTGAPCLGLRTTAHPVVLPDGRRVEGRTWGYRNGRCPFDDGGGYGEEMAARGLQRQVTVGDSTLTVFRLQDCFEVIAEALRRGKDDFPPCSACPIRPHHGPDTVPSDWDVEGQCLLPDSPAWEY